MPTLIDKLRAALNRRGMTAPTLPAAGARPSGPTMNGVSDSMTFGNATIGYRTRSSATLSEMRDAKPMERRDAMKNARFLRAKLGIIKALFANSTRYALGRGLMPSSGCADEEWAAMADDLFLEWASKKTYDIREELNFFQAQKVLLPDVMCDGDAGAAPVRDFDGGPRVQHFPSDLINDAAGESVFNVGGRGRWREGILRNAVGTPVAYRVLRDPTALRTDSTGRAYWDYPARNFWHIGRTDRINANRPLPWIHHGDQSALNILDLNVLEMQAAKLNSYFAAAIKTAGGEMPASIMDMLTTETEEVRTGTDGDGNAVTTQVERSYLNLMGGAGIPVLEPGEELQFFKNERPSTTFAGFIDYLITDIAIGFGTPKEFVWGVSGLAGPQARLVLQQADWFFTDAADMLVSDYCQPVWETFIAEAMNTGRLRPPAPGTNWRNVQWQGPGSLTIDKGRDGRMYLEMIANGVERRSVWHQMTGKDGRTELRKTVAEVRFIMDLCREAGVPVEYVLGKQAVKGATDPTDPNEMAEEIATRMAAG